MKKKVIRILALITIWFHIVWTSFLVIGIVIASRYETYEKINFAMILITVGGWMIFRSCPVTIFENYLHGKYDKSKMYEGSCIQQYLRRVNIHLEHQTITILLVSILAISFFLTIR